ncbi:retropepsin-like aspartic protease family protein [Parvibium lacunae]|uniref:TIGR02281 family clan AA aspartic protease n=1 Tax=Parvibium lacunae TaxID=1888893 RepID=A0A368L6I1_9BURK|nr:TIGR02281 family clan AA aspartic protease [Parvibium lacunae]RCS59237.1 TIGR02281 family clan AA aspartic protease [Parvibium lacunae]
MPHFFRLAPHFVVTHFARRGIYGACLLLILFFLPRIVWSQDVVVMGIFPNKVVLSVDHGLPKTLAVGEPLWQGMRLLRTEGDEAWLEIGGQVQRLSLGSYRAKGAAAGQRTTVTLKADARGHFMTVGKANGGSLQFMVDTGASVVAISLVEARRLGINYLNGRRAAVQTANGPTLAYYVKLDSLAIGPLELNQVDAVILENLGGVALLGMSFLNRMEMQRTGDTLVLTKRY